jgi:hypothetical protein
MSKIIEASQLPEGDKVYLKKDFLGWRIVHPWRDENYSINWINVLIGGWRNLVTLIILVSFLLWIQYDTNNQISDYKDYCETISKDPIKFCTDIGFYEAIQKLQNKSENPFSNFNLSEALIKNEG